MRHAIDLILLELARPAVRGVAAWAALAGIACDLLFAALPARIRPGSLLATLSTRATGWWGAVLVGLLHPLVIGGGALALTLAATRSDALRDWWWAAGLGGGTVLMLVVLLAGSDVGLRRGLPMLLVGLAIAVVVRLTGATL